MSKKGPDMYNQLSKRDQKVHFASERGNGKGDHRRKFTKESEQAFKDGWDKIWGGKNG